MSVLAESLNEGASGLVIALTCLVDDGDSRACEPEEIERMAKEGLVEIPSTDNLRFIGLNPVAPFHVNDWSILGLVSE